VGLGFKFVDGEGKTMGLSAYGDPEKAYRALRVIAPSFQNNKWLGHSSWSDFRLIESPTLMFNTKWGRYLRNVVKNHERADVAAAAQRILEEELNNYINYLLAKTKLKDLVLAGGIFLNVTFNGKLSRRKDINSIYIHPYPADGGTAAGAALELHARLSQNNTNYLMTSAYLGTSYEESEIQRALDSFGDKINYDRVDNISELAATLIKEGEIIGWFQGRAEWGPRALGNRSVLGDPRNSDTRERLNKLLKNRDWFMPFAPSILEEYLDEYFENSFFAPFMTFAFIIKEEKAALIPAALHKDGTARPNVVRKDTNPRYYELIDNFRKLTGLPVVLNTSFNRHGLPLINTPKEAIDHLLWGCVDKLCIGPFIVRRNVAIQHVDRFTEEALKAAYIDEDALLSASKNMQ
jgi:carbamoyltransferase